MMPRKALHHRISTRHLRCLVPNAPSQARYTKMLSRLLVIQSASAPHPRFRVNDLFIRCTTRHSVLPVISVPASIARTLNQTVFSVWHSGASRLSMLLLSSRTLSLMVLCLPIPSGSTSPRKVQSCTLAELMPNVTRETLPMYLSSITYVCAE